MLDEDWVRHGGSKIPGDALAARNDFLSVYKDEDISDHVELIPIDLEVPI